MSTPKYDRHSSEWSNYLEDSYKKKLGDAWREKNTLDYWRHERLRNSVKPIIEENYNATWLTVGDGRYGTDANHLLNMGAKNVHCSDISDCLLKIGASIGFINEYSTQNAEALSFKNDDFDYVLCKDAFHHFPRPYLALNEMFRVARKAVILIEPRDHKIDKAFFSLVYNGIRILLKRGTNEHGFEEIGNYVYSTSERELEKFLLGQHYRLIAYNPVNDAYQEGIEFINADEKNVRNRIITIKIKFKIFLLNLMTILQLMNSGVLRVALFKEKPSDSLIERMKLFGWKFRELPKNPYI